MDVIGFLCVSLGSSTIQPHDSLRSRRACAFSEACFIDKVATVLEKCTTAEQHSAVLFLWAKEPNTKNIHKEMFLVYGGKCLSRKAVGSRNSLKDLTRSPC
jgi:hypothetical protein